MPLDGLTLGFIAKELHALLAGGRIDKISQPERDELLLLIRSQGQNRQLLISASANHARAHLTNIKKQSPLEPPMFCMLLRKHLLSGRILEVRQWGGDRVLEICVETTGELGDRARLTLVAELMGKHSNIMLLRADGRLIDSVRHVTEEISRVREILPGLRYERPPGQGKIPYTDPDERALGARLAQAEGSLCKALSETISGLSALTARELSFRALGDEEARVTAQDPACVAGRVCAAIRLVTEDLAPGILLDEAGSPAEFVAFPYLCRAAFETLPMPTLSEAMDVFYQKRDRADRMAQKAATLRRVLKGHIGRCEKKLSLQLLALTDARRMEEFRVKGELLTASRDRVKKGMRSVSLPNYYSTDMEDIVIELDEKLSPAVNAQRYFKQYQKARSAQRLAAEQQKRTEEELRYLEGQMDNLEKSEEEAELNEIRQELEALGYARANGSRKRMKAFPESRPLHFLSAAGLHILVGKNNLQNDKLTQSAKPGETWLHVKEMPGSHVVIASERIDEESLRTAALLAAYYSKGRSGSQIPVDYTLKKYVKKPGGARPGLVIYTHQRTLYVTPDAAQIDRVTRV